MNQSAISRRALITGAASGIGAATAERLADQGYALALTDVAAADGQALADRLAAALPGQTIVFHALDVSDPVAIARVAEVCLSDLGGLDALINNAGTVRPGPVDSPNYDAAWSLSFSVMATAHQRLVRAVLPALRESASGRIVNVASTEGLGASPMNSAYAAAKAAVIGLTRGLAVDLGRDSITVNAVCPGPVSTGLTQAIPDEAKAKFARSRTALGRYGQPEEIAAAIAFCASKDASFMTGSALVVDGGLIAKNA